MRFMLLLKATKNSEQGVLPTGKLIDEMMTFNESMARAGVLLGGDGLQASSKGARVKVGGGKRTVTEGPFAELGQLVAGFWIIKAASKKEAIDWALRCPDPMPGEETEIEVRQLFDAEDFAESDPTGELRAREEQLRAATSA